MKLAFILGIAASLAGAGNAYAQHCNLPLSLVVGGGQVYVTCVFGGNIANYTTSGSFEGSTTTIPSPFGITFNLGRLVVNGQTLLGAYGLGNYAGTAKLKEEYGGGIVTDPSNGKLIEQVNGGVAIISPTLAQEKLVATDAQGVVLSGGSLAVSGKDIWHSLQNPYPQVGTSFYKYKLSALEAGNPTEIASFQIPINLAGGQEIAADAQGNLYVCAIGSNGAVVNKYTIGGTLLFQTPGFGSSCDGVTVDTDNTIYAAGLGYNGSTYGSVFVFDSSGNLINSFN